MERGHIRHHSDHFSANPQSHSLHTSYPPSFSPPKPIQSQMLFGDPSAQNRDPFLHKKSSSREDDVSRSRAWSNSQVHQASSPPFHQQARQEQSLLQGPPKFLVPPQPTQSSNAASNALSTVYDSQRRRSISAANPTQFVSESPIPIFAPRAMLPPSPHQRSPSNPQNTDGSNSSLFSGIRDLANISSTRKPASGMSISSMLGNDEGSKTTAISPHSAASHPPPTRDLMHPPSPGRVRSASMRESSNLGRGYLERSPPRSTAGPRSATTHREGGFNELFPTQSTNGSIPRPSSQPIDQTAHRHDSDVGKLGTFRTFNDARQEPSAFGSQTPQYSPIHSSFREMREDQAALFRPAYPSFDGEKNGDRHNARTPPLTHEPNSYSGSFRNGQDRPFTFEEHQRFENAQMLERKDSTGSVPRSVLNISPELNRRGRDSPLPQAVQGVARRHIGPGGDHPAGIKSEFGRMFSGLGSGVGSATPVAGQSMNGTGTPRLQSPRLDEDEYDQPRSASVSAIKKNARRREDDGEIYDGRMTPSLSRGMKRSKTTHPPHHHHHHHHHARRHVHDVADANGGYGMIRFPSNPQPSTQHRHIHLHNNSHVHHHHHVPRSAPLNLKRGSLVIKNNDVLAAAAKKPRKHLGSMPYNIEVAAPSKKMLNEHELDYSASPELMPDFEGKENCLFTIRVPKWYTSQTRQDLESGEVSRLSEICRNRRVWGTDIYTDDSDVVAAAVHAGWITGDYGALNKDLQELGAEDEGRGSEDDKSLVHDVKPARPVNIPNKDMHITVLILPPLQAYTSSHRNHITSRDWIGAPHDGMSFMIHKIQFVEEGRSDRGFARDAQSRKARMTREESDRRQAAADALLMLPNLNRRTLNIAVKA